MKDSHVSMWDPLARVTWAAVITLILLAVFAWAINEFYYFRNEKVFDVGATVEDVYPVDDNQAYEVVIRENKSIGFVRITKDQFYLYDLQVGQCIRLEKHITPKPKVFADYYEVLGECEQ
jgi:hypothetical protein